VRKKKRKKKKKCRFTDLKAITAGNPKHNCSVEINLRGVRIENQQSPYLSSCATTYPCHQNNADKRTYE